MPRRVITVYVCSLCSTEHSEGEVSSFLLVWPTGEKLSYDVCMDCYVAPTMKTLLEAGEKPTGRSTPARTTSSVPNGPVCDVPGCSFVARSANGLGLHKHNQHGITSAAMQRKQAKQQRTA